MAHIWSMAHTWKLSRMPRTLSVEQKISCGVILLNMTNFACHLDQTCSTWQAILHYMTQLLFMWSNDKLLHICNVEQFVITPYDEFIFPAFLWFTLFWRKIYFVAIYAILCGAKINPNILSVEQKWQISCMYPIYIQYQYTLILDIFC